MEQAKGILLLGINAKYIHTNLALYSLRQYAIKAAGMYGDYYRENIFLREYTINHRTEEILRGIYKVRPQVLYAISDHDTPIYIPKRLKQ